VRLAILNVVPISIPRQVIVESSIGSLIRYHQMPDDHQHFVPQLLLRNFATGSRRNKQIWVFDKQTGKEFRTAVRNVATEGGFYDLSSMASVTPSTRR
jgi:hypothetical protein